MTGRAGGFDDGARPGLVLRILVEGPPDGGTGTVLNHVAERFLSSSSAAWPDGPAQGIQSYEFEAGQFEGRPIRFEVIAYGSDADRSTRAQLRSLVDSVIVVADSRPDGLGPAYRHFGEVLDDVRDEPAPARPTVTVFAHNADAPGALPPDAVAAELLAESWVDVVPTTAASLGSLRGLGHAAGLAVRRAQHRDELGLPRRTGEGLDPSAAGAGAQLGSGARSGTAQPPVPASGPRRNARPPMPPAAARAIAVVATTSAQPPPPAPPEPGAPSGNSSVLRRLRTALKGSKAGADTADHAQRPRSRHTRART